MAESGQYRHSVCGDSEEVKDIYCEPCQRDGLVVIAEGYCVDCPEYLCTQCYKIHRRNKILANHVLLNKDKMPTASDSSTTVLDVCKEKCTSHPDKVIELYCANCNKVGCYICVSLYHRQCKTVQHIPDIATNFRSTLNEKIKSTAEELSKYNEKLQAKITSNNKMKELAIQEIKNQRDEFNNIFDQLEKKMNEKITPTEKRNKNALKLFSHKIDHVKKEFYQINNDIHGMRKGQNCGQFIAMTQCQDKMIALHKQFEDMERELNITVQCYKLFPSEQILAMIQTMMGTTTELCRMATASLETQINIPSSTTIICLTIVQGHYCVVVNKDNANHSIKVIDAKSKRVTSETNTEAKDIVSITTFPDDKVAVSAERYVIQFFTVSESGVIQRTNQLDVHCSYMFVDMVHCQGNIYGIGWKRNRIDILNMTKKNNRAYVNNNLFGSPQGIAVSPDGQTIYVTDGLKHCVTSFNFDGEVGAIYTDKDLKDPRGIIVDKYGYVYVHSTGTQSIQQLTADLKMFQVLLENQVPRYQGNGNNMTYSSSEHKLYINAGTHINQYSLDC